MLKNIIYRLMRSDKVFPAALYHLTSASPDYVAGTAVNLFDVTLLRRTLLTNSDVLRTFIYEEWASNFKEGGHFDKIIKYAVVMKEDLRKTDGSFTALSLNDFLVYNDQKYEIISKMDDQYCYVCKMLAIESSTPYDDVTVSYLTRSSCSAVSKIAIDSLIRDIKYYVFGGTMPSDFKVIPFVGTLKELPWGSDLTGTITPYKEYGVDSVITGLTVGCNWTATLADFDDCHFSVWGNYETTDELYLDNGDTIQIGLVGGKTKCTIGSGYIETTAPVTSGHILVNSPSADKLDVYVDGVINATNATARTGTTFTSPSLKGDSHIKFATLGRALTASQVAKLYEVATDFLRMLGRI